MKKILITGANGQLGQELRRLVEPDEAIYTDVEELDITDRNAVKAFFREHAIRACFNAAAYTAVDKAESDRDTAFRINAKGPQYLAEACEQHGALMLHISTDFVFDGKARVPYRETDPMAPLSVYGLSKAEGEQAVLQSCSQAVVIRTSWLYSQWGTNFVKTMLRLGGERSELGVVNDQTGSPTWARDLAAAVLCFVKGHLQPEDYGVYHYANTGTTSWAGLADRVMQTAGLSCIVRPISTAEYPTPAARPAWSVLDCSRIVQRFKLHIPVWEDSVQECVNLLLNTEKNAG